MVVGTVWAEAMERPIGKTKRKQITESMRLDRMNMGTPHLKPALLKALWVIGFYFLMRVPQTGI